MLLKALQSANCFLRLFALWNVVVPIVAFELWVGVQDLSTTSNVIVWVNNSWADGFSIGFPAIFNDTDLYRLAITNEFRLVAGIHASLETFQRQLYNGDSCAFNSFQEAFERELPAYIAIAGQAPRPFLWMCFIEDDSSGVGYPYTQLAAAPSDHTEAYDQFRDYIQRAIAFTMALGPPTSNTPLVAQVGFGERVHVYFSQGVTLALIERANDDIGDLNTAIAFARGGARQFNAAWGVGKS